MLPFQKTSTTMILQPEMPPEKELVFAFTCEPEDILDLFEQIATHLGFDLIEREATYSTAVKKNQNKSSLMNMINCFGCWHFDGVTAIKITLSKYSQKGTLKDKFIAQVKGLVGVAEQLQIFLSNFNDKISKCGFVAASPNIIMGQQPQQMIDISQNENPYYLEACSHHLIGKLILNEKYDINAFLEKTLQDYSNTFKNIEESIGLLPLPMKNAISIVSDIHQQLDKLLLQLRYPKQILAFSRISIENFIFNKVESQLYSIYHIKNMKTDQQFQHKKNKIISIYTLHQIITEVCLSEKFWSLNKARFQDNLTLKQLKNQIYFGNVCKQFQKIVFTNSPRQKIKYCQFAYTQLKNHFYDFSRRKYQLTSMEDIIPVLIVIVLVLEIGSFRSELDIMLDFISFDPSEMEAEKRLIINISESYNYIFRDWTVKQ